MALTKEPNLSLYNGKHQADPKRRDILQTDPYSSEYQVKNGICPLQRLERLDGRIRSRIEKKIAMKDFTGKIGKTFTDFRSYLC